MKWSIENDLGSINTNQLLKESVTSNNFSDILIDTVILEE